MKDFLFVNLAAQADTAKPFDGMAAGSFTDMRGRKVEFDAADLPEWVANTREAIASTADDTGAIVGLPIDQRGHYHDEDAAGWIVDVNLSADGQKIRFTPRWTETGLRLIGQNLQRFFSPTVDPENRVIAGGSLTNWPATRTKKGKILLKPVELSMSDETLTNGDTAELIDGSLDERSNACRQAFYKAFGDTAWAVEVFETYLIATSDNVMWRIPYTVEDGIYVFAPRIEWVKVRLSYVEASMQYVFTPQGDIQTGASTMPEPADVVSPPAAVELTAEQTARIDELVTAQLTKINAAFEESVNLRVAERLAEKERETKTSAFALRMASAGLPIEAAELTAFLTSLSTEQQGAAEKILSRVVEAGIVPMAELGHSQTMTGTKPLPDNMAGSLKLWLKSGQTIAEFFRVNAVELGAQADYNLAEYEVNNG